MKSPLTFFRKPEPIVPAEAADAKESRLGRIVGRQRELSTSARLGRLSRQESDPAPEESGSPLYGPAAYGGHDPQS